MGAPGDRGLGGDGLLLLSVDRLRGREQQAESDHLAGDPKEYDLLAISCFHGTPVLEAQQHCGSHHTDKG